MKSYRLVFPILFLFCFSELAAQQSGSLLPFGEEEAASTVSQFITAFNNRQYQDARNLVSNNLKSYEYYLGEERFGLQEWIENPVDYYMIHLYNSEYYQINVLNRVVNGSFVTQKERWVSRNKDSTIGSRTVMTTYKVRNGKIHRTWYFPESTGDVPSILNPTYKTGSEPTVWMDLAHNNIDAPETTYFKFAELLRQDGYKVKIWDQPFTSASLDTIDILTIVNALPDSHSDGMQTPGETVPSAFTRDEIQAVRQWVENGGSLLLIADHHPMAGASKELAAVFGATFHNGSARDTTNNQNTGRYSFNRADGSLISHEITDGSQPYSRIDSLMSFLGQAFEVSDEFEPILKIPGSMVFVPSGTLDNSSQWISPAGWVQGAVREYGEGRVALFGEAWMFRFFTSSELDPNALFVRNLMRWLAKIES